MLSFQQFITIKLLTHLFLCILFGIVQIFYKVKPFASKVPHMLNFHSLLFHLLGLNNTHLFLLHLPPFRPILHQFWIIFLILCLLTFINPLYYFSVYDFPIKSSRIFFMYLFLYQYLDSPFILQLQFNIFFLVIPFLKFQAQQPIIAWPYPFI